ncbi:MAG TPA: GGDEF domain-containing protein [Caldimonas sp.]|jgi:diguanylate cyclase (GGDEF)-like protein|nr:GGDEF domain-containing protein [Caldimonas sp.]HEX2540050.1 GGDEF domain-containing protein [Caldimonas sp.]
MPHALRLLFVAPLPLFTGGAAALTAAPSVADACELLSGGAPFDALLLDGAASRCATHEVESIRAATALVVVFAEPSLEASLDWLRRGADDVVGAGEVETAAGQHRLRLAVERRRLGEAQRLAYATDVATGLPHRQQLVEHLSQLLALREREPSPMAVVAFRIEGLGLRGKGAEAVEGEVLRRKIAVRLRAGVRASDVVAAVDDDAFSVLLVSILATDDAERVAGKLATALLAPFTVGGVERSVGVAVGVARYPQDGKDAERLLRRAVALAAAAPAAGQAGLRAAHDDAGVPRTAANDDG